MRINCAQPIDKTVCRLYFNLQIDCAQSNCKKSNKGEYDYEYL